jgi:hypothetical protein
MSIRHPYAGRLDFHGGRNITRWRPAVQWLLVMLQLVIVSVCAICGTGRPRSPNAYPEQLDRWAPPLPVVPGHSALLASATSLGVYRCALRVVSSAGLLTDAYPRLRQPARPPCVACCRPRAALVCL